MAKEGGAGAPKQNGAKASKDPVWMVFAITGPKTFKLLNPEVTAPSREAACDQVVESLPDDQRKLTAAAFLARNYEEFDYEPEQKVVLHKKRRKSPTPGAAAV